MQTLQETGAFCAGREAGYGLDFNSQRNYEPRRPNIALAGILLSCPAVIIAIITLLAAGYPLLQSLLIAFCLQIFVFCLVLVIGYLQADTPTGAYAVARDQEPPLFEPTERWKSYQNPGANIVSQRIAVISTDIAQGQALATNFADLGREVHHCTDRDAILECVSARPEDWDLVICDLDTAPDPQAVMDDLADFCATCPDMPVLLFSGGELRSAFSPDCRSVWDAVLGQPVFRKPLGEGVEAANCNLTAAE